MVADSGKPHTKPEDNAAATDSDSVNPEDQDKSEAPSSANQGAEQNSAEDKDQEPQAAVGEHCGTDDSLTAYEVGVSYIEPYRGSAWRPDVDAYDPCAELILDHDYVRGRYWILAVSHHAVSPWGFFGHCDRRAVRFFS
ncbi:hypothetical protein NLL32_09615 [Corynebacterium propinquum]|uniref:hypothetical protein n=1 Tax=Corynebacterium propinquum TaxID=43769 RepID=UPI00266E9E62|nr:hypothetical protein [Corynebacterium propinquum]WKS50563.1 hypothetical protein NLL32_09615 [Corynebacterium propinquum]